MSSSYRARYIYSSPKDDAQSQHDAFTHDVRRHSFYHLLTHLLLVYSAVFVLTVGGICGFLLWKKRIQPAGTLNWATVGYIGFSKSTRAGVLNRMPLLPWWCHSNPGLLRCGREAPGRSSPTLWPLTVYRSTGAPAAPKTDGPKLTAAVPGHV